MNTQFKKGVLELCVLSLLKHGDKYGYELADTVGKQIDVSEGTIYPLLKRLRAGILKCTCANPHRDPRENITV